MMLTNILGMAVNQDTVGGLILVAFVGAIGFIIKGVISNHGTISVAKINSETTLGSKAIETLTTALEVLQEENRSLKQANRQMEDEIDRLIDHILRVVKATTPEEIKAATDRLEQFIRQIGRWPSY